MAIVFSRIDDRLLHGQVMTSWIDKLGIEQCIVVNEAIERDELQKQLLELAVQGKIRVVFFSPQRFAEISQSNPIKRRSMLLFNNPADVLYLVEHGVTIDKLNVGGMKNDGTKRQIARAVAVNDDDAKTLRKIASLGVEVSIQMVPNDKEISLESALE